MLSALLAVTFSTLKCVAITVAAVNAVVIIVVLICLFLANRPADRVVGIRNFLGKLRK